MSMYNKSEGRVQEHGTCSSCHDGSTLREDDQCSVCGLFTDNYGELFVGHDKRSVPEPRSTFKYVMEWPEGNTTHGDLSEFTSGPKPEDAVIMLNGRYPERRYKVDRLYMPEDEDALHIVLVIDEMQSEDELYKVGRKYEGGNEIV